MTNTAAKRLITLCFVALLAACASNAIEPTTDYDSNFDFSAVKSVAIQPFERNTPASVMVSDMQADRVGETLAAELRNRGLAVVSDNNEADLLLVWHLVTRDKTDVRSYNSAAMYNCWGCGPSVSDVSVRQYTEGTFIVDMIDPLRQRSVWRSIVQSRIQPQPDPERAAQNRREGAAAIFANFPPQPGV